MRDSLRHNGGVAEGAESAAVRTALWRRVIPALTLVLAAPLIAEVLPGATRFSAIFVFPIEMCVWGCGALLIRAAVRRWRLGWLNMLMLAASLAIAEECLIQQTSLAPMVLQLKGQEYARALGVNYVYLLWAVVYEAVFVVFVPVYLVELVFEDRRDRTWLTRTGLVAAAVLFGFGSVLAWYTWTRIARPQVFHVPAYTPPPAAIATAVATIVLLLLTSLGPVRNELSLALTPRDPPAPWVLAAAGGVSAVLWYGLALLAFGIAPSFPPSVAVCAGLILAASLLWLLPRWAGGAGWRGGHTFGLLLGTMLGSMMVGFVGFIGAARADLYFKIIVDVFAVVLLIRLGLRTKHRIPTYPRP